jgi:hypothetical protein
LPNSTAVDSTAASISSLAARVCPSIARCCCCCYCC